MTAPQPCIVGVAQVVQRPDQHRLTDAAGPIELMVAAARAAGADAAAPGLLGSVGWLGATGGWYRYANPASLVAEQLGSPGARTAFTSVSGTSPQDLVTRAAMLIAAGECEVAVVVGGEARWTTQRLKRAGLEPSWITAPGTGQPEGLDGFDPAMIAESVALGAPVTAYALIEDAIRVAAGRTVDQQRDVAATLWSAFSEVAAHNADAWDRRAYAPAEIRDAGPHNRMISFPYTKAMVANNTVDMATAVLLTSDAVADRMGISAERRVYPIAATAAHETWTMARRRELHHLPALAAAGERAMTLAGAEPAQVAHVDLYACFPSIVQCSAPALGFSLDRQLTLTGGLCFAGAPIANAAGHAIAAAVDRVRGGGIGLVHANGGNATKHAFGIYAPGPYRAFTAETVAAPLDHRPDLAHEWCGDVTVVAATVVYGRDGPERAVAMVESGHGGRALAWSTDPDVFAAATSTGLAGATGRRDAGGQLTLDGWR